MDALLDLPAAAALAAAAATRPLTRPAARARSSVSDFLCHAFCTCCSLAREAREIQSQTLADVLGGADADLEVV